MSCQSEKASSAPHSFDGGDMLMQDTLLNDITNLMSQTDDSHIFSQLELAAATDMPSNMAYSTAGFCESSFDLGDRTCPSENNNSSVLFNDKSMSFIHLKESAMDDSKFIDPRLFLHPFKDSGPSETPVNSSLVAQKYGSSPMLPTKRQRKTLARLSLVNKTSLFSEDIPMMMEKSLSPPAPACLSSEKENMAGPDHHIRLPAHRMRKPLGTLKRERAPLSTMSQNVPPSHYRPIQSASYKKGSMLVAQRVEPETDMRQYPVVPYLPRSLPEAYHFAPAGSPRMYHPVERHCFDISAFSSIYVDFSLTREGLLPEKRLVADELQQQNKVKSRSSSAYDAEVVKSKKKRSDKDLYNPQWIRGKGKDREGKCEHCPEEVWLNLKKSAYW